MIRREAINWLKEANYDLRRARRSLNDGDYALCVFMAQQAVEKAFKAIIIGIKHKPQPRTYDLTVLYNEVKDALPLPNDVADRLPTLSQYYVTSRYPNAGLEVPSESISRTQAEEALNVAEAIINHASRLLT
ncbi:MAG: HEPN domain-containing protein [Caldivirga sp.]|uniref:HEPN domain-containing protein n=1 Tax=Caldivirga sp. TaxID=2080243 RepID=UPI003D1135E2